MVKYLKSRSKTDLVMVWKKLSNSINLKKWFCELFEKEKMQSRKMRYRSVMPDDLALIFLYMSVHECKLLEWKDNNGYWQSHGGM